MKKIISFSRTPFSLHLPLKLRDESNSLCKKKKNVNWLISKIIIYNTEYINATRYSSLLQQKTAYSISLGG